MAEMISDSLNIEVGDLFIDRTNNNKLYIYTSKWHSQEVTKGQVGGKLVPNHSIAHIFSSANRPTDYKNYKELARENGYKSATKTSSSTARLLEGTGLLGPVELHENAYLLDIESSIDDVERFTNNDLKELSLSALNQKKISKGSAESFNLLRVDNAEFESFTKALKARGKGMDAFGVKDGTLSDFGLSQLEKENIKNKPLAMVDANGIVAMLDDLDDTTREKNEKLVKYFEQFKGKSGNQNVVALTAADESGNAFTGEVINAVTRLASDSNKRVIAHNADFDMGVLEHLSGLESGVLTRDDSRIFAATIIHQFAGKDVPVEKLEKRVFGKYGGMLRGYGSMGVAAMNESLKTLTSGWSSLSFKAGTSVETLFNLMQDTLYGSEDTKPYQAELHKASSDIDMTRSILTDLPKFARKMYTHAETHKMSVDEAFEQNVLLTEMKKQLYLHQIGDDEQVKIIHGLKQQMILQNAHKGKKAPSLDFFIKKNTQKHLESIEKYYSPTGKPTGILSSVMTNTFGTGMGGLLGGMALATGVSLGVEKIKRMDEKVSGSQRLEGMGHNSLLTTINRLYNTEFGSGLQSGKFLGKLLTGGVKTFFAKTGRKSTIEFGRAISDFIKRGQFRTESVKSVINKAGTAIRRDFPFKSNEGVQRFAGMLENFGDVPLNKKFNESLRSGATLAQGFLTNTASVFFRKQKTIVPWIGIGLGAMTAMNVAAGTYRPTNTENRYTPISPLDPYQRKKFKEIEDTTRKMALTDALRMEDKGINTYNTGDQRRQGRLNLTDFSSSRMPGNPTSLTYSTFNATDSIAWNIDDPYKDRTGTTMAMEMKTGMQRIKDVTKNIDMGISIIKQEQNELTKSEQYLMKAAVFDASMSNSVILPYSERSMMLSILEPNSSYFANYESAAKFKADENYGELNTSIKNAAFPSNYDLHDEAIRYQNETSEYRNPGMSAEDLDRLTNQPNNTNEKISPLRRLLGTTTRDQNVTMPEIINRIGKPNVQDTPVSVNPSIVNKRNTDYKLDNRSRPINYKNMSRVLSSLFHKTANVSHNADGLGVARYLDIPYSEIKASDNMDFVLSTGGGPQKLDRPSKMLLRNIPGDSLSSNYDKIEMMDRESRTMGSLNRNRAEKLNIDQTSDLTYNRSNSPSGHKSFGTSAGRSGSFNSSVSINETGKSGSTGKVLK